MSATRTESDSFGSLDVPADRYWGANTQRALQNFPIGSERQPAELIHALGLVKLAAARVNMLQGRLDARLGEAIVAAAAEVAGGRWDDHFPLPVWQTGSGTQTNMNANEVVANRACELLGGRLGSRDPVHPNNHVNLSQSSNDTYPTAIHIAAGLMTRDVLLPGLQRLHAALADKATAFGGIVKTGRTHAMDAVPLTLGQEFGGYAAQVGQAIARIEAARPELHALAQGGTAVGTGLGTRAGFADLVAAELAQLTGLPLTSAPDKFAVLAAHDALVAYSGVLKAAAVALFKVANDLRLLGSGPRCGLGELRLPRNEPGSSIMPGKVNPTQVEALTMVCVQVMGNDAAIGFAGSQGLLELNVYKPLLGHALLQSVRLLGEAADSFAHRCVEGLEADFGRIAAFAERSLMLGTVLVPLLGYDAVSEAAQAAHDHGTTLRQEVLRLGLTDERTFDRLVDPGRMTAPEA